MIKNLHWIVEKMTENTCIETMSACQLINGLKEVNTKHTKEHQKVRKLDKSMIETMHLIAKQIMEISYVDDMLTCQSLDDW